MGKEDGDNRENKSSRSNITKEWDTILNYMKNNSKTTKATSVKSCSNTINLHPLVIKLLKPEKKSAQKNMNLMK